MERSDAYRRFQFVRSEYETVLTVLNDAVERIRSGAAAGAMLGRLHRSRSNLERTYILRLFSEFEGVLIDYWRMGIRRRTTPVISIVMNRIADVRRIPDSVRDDLHQAREIRNEVVHRQLILLPMTIDEFASRVSRFVSWLPPSW